MVAIQMTAMATTIFDVGPSVTKLPSEIVKPSARVATVPAKMAKNDSHPTRKPAIG